MKICPSCKADLEGELIYDQFLRTYGGDEAKALHAAKMYGASKTEGRSSRRIAIYDFRTDRTIEYQCPNCKHKWDRELKCQQ